MSFLRRFVVALSVFSFASSAFAGAKGAMNCEASGKKFHAKSKKSCEAKHGTWIEGKKSAAAATMGKTPAAAPAKATAGKAAAKAPAKAAAKAAATAPAPETAPVPVEAAEEDVDVDAMDDEGMDAGE